MPRCCPESTAPAIREGRNIAITGNATPQDPLTISATTELEVQNNDTFRLLRTGDGTLDSPYRLEVTFASTAGLEDFPDVDPTGRLNGYVLAWDTTRQQWVTTPPNTASPGAVLTGNGLTGDGSSGNPLRPVINGLRYLEVTTSGIGLSNAGVNALVRGFDTEAARTAASPAPTLGTLSIVGTNPDQIDRWDGSAWQPVTGGNRKDIQSGQLLALSGPYAGGMTTTYVAQLSAVTDSTGAFVVIDSDDLAGYSGVLFASVQETGGLAWKANLGAAGGQVIATAQRLSTGAAYANVTVTGMVHAILY